VFLCARENPSQGRSAEIGKIKTISLKSIAREIARDMSNIVSVRSEFITPESDAKILVLYAIITYVSQVI